MSDLRLTRRSTLASLGMVGIGSAAAGAGTVALFKDDDTSSPTMQAAGGVDLTQGTSTNVLWTAGPLSAAEREWGRTDLELADSSDLGGDLTISVPSVTSTEGPTPDGETNTAPPGEGDEELFLRLWIGMAGSDDTTWSEGTDYGLETDGTWTQSNKAGWDEAYKYDNVSWDNILTDFSGPVTFNARVVQATDGDEDRAQGDDLTVEFQFTLEHP